MSTHSPQPQTKNQPDPQSQQSVDLDGVASEPVEEQTPDKPDLPESGSEAVADITREDLMEQLASALARIDEMQDGYVRAKAEVENIRRRSQNEMISARKFAVEGFARALLSVVDSLDQAARVEMDGSNSEAVGKMKEGLDLTLKQFETVMEKFGVVPVEAEVGVKFNPDLHQAISMVPSNEVAPDHIVNVMQKGFSLKDRLLRPAMVVIAESTANH